MGVSADDSRPTIVVEHLDPELETWQELEYRCIAEECETADWSFILSGLHDARAVSKQLGLPASKLTQESVERLYSTQDARQKICLLDPKATHDLSPEDASQFDVFLFGGILGDDPPRDRTGELRKLGLTGRRLGSEQMTTDTAARVTRIVIRNQKRLQDIPYVDRPDIEISSDGDTPSGAHPSESINMPFKYVKADDGKPVMPKGMLQLLAVDADKNILDLL